VELRGRIDGVELSGSTLSFALRHASAGSARCEEVLALLGLWDPAGEAGEPAPGLARLLRTGLDVREDGGRTKGKAQT
jgi:hypothetical protein